MAIRISKKSTTKQAGVTLVELIVVIGIVSLVSTVLIFNYSSFSTNVSLRNLAQEMALAVRKAQTYATSVQSISGTTAETSLFPAYGITFSPEVVPIGGTQYHPTNKRFVLYADIPDDGEETGDRAYTNNTAECGRPEFGNECLEVFTINSADRIVELCTDLTGCIGGGMMNVIFRRPAPDAVYCTDAEDNCSSGDMPSYLRIVIESAKGDTKAISVWNTGQISIE